MPSCFDSSGTTDPLLAITQRVADSTLTIRQTQSACASVKHASLASISLCMLCLHTRSVPQKAEYEWVVDDKPAGSRCVYVVRCGDDTDKPQKSSRKCAFSHAAMLGLMWCCGCFSWSCMLGTATALIVHTKHPSSLHKPARLHKKRTSVLFYMRIF
jgi:hypothetical protein